MKTKPASFKLKFKKAYLIPGLSLFLLPLIHFPFLHFSFTAAKELTFKTMILLAFLALFTIGLRKEKFQAKKITDNLIFSLLCIQLILHALSNFLSEHSLVAMYGTYSRGGGFIFELYLFAFIIWNALFLNKESINKVIKLFWASALLVAIYGCLQKLGIEWFFQNYSTNLFQGRIFSFSGNPSLLGQLMLLSTILGFYLLNEAKNKKEQTIFGIGTMIMILTMLLSGTRAALLGLIGVSFLSLIRYRKEIWLAFKKLRWKTLFILPILALMFWLAPADRFSLSSLSLRSLDSRFEIWKGSIQLIENKWLLGYGQESFYIHFPEIVTKNFFTLEENISISADRVHNEWLEKIYSHGIPAGLLYLALHLLILKKFFTTKEKMGVALAGLILANGIQNQFSFSDPSIHVILAFAWGSLVALESRSATFKNPLFKKKTLKIALSIFSLLFISFLGFHTVLKPLQSYRLYTLSQNNGMDYAVAVNSLKKALTWTPYYIEPWYELMFIDPSSMPRALTNLELIEGNSGNVLAWKGNLYADINPQIAAEYYIKALEKNPHHPNWIRAFGDMLYTQGDCQSALYLYSQYLEAAPEYWKWSVDIENHSATEQKSYETFFKKVPYFSGTLEKMEICQGKLE